MIGVNDDWDDDIYIYGIYHSNGDVYFYGISGEKDNALIAFRQRDIKIKDPKLTYDMVYFGNDGRSHFMMLHWALAEDGLLDKLLERDPDSLALFSKLRWLDRKQEFA
ncbi:hypothetical protein OHW25_02225 [Acinetobacter baumannii]|uniref:hypothetical protein n=1 Tax=Acinetobacter calcoaceticus/baumannii complex TaxID=909768 RepID=UPI00045373C2|nr:MULTISPECIES: hypothetical protein [Acinetobacter calcoaceticus/baumannii complex]EXB79615.1 hypothetical protein J542_3652 [Acinetobacter baumannii 299505]EXE63512.1 hypothetical protein J580_0634 [Acinetobacter sp. 1542444]MCW1490385.1 hypothetical protein [Acinetobacter baumannii]MDC4776618.1 hypothetical protein [Acinetobacter baumannii]MDC5044758.1 hypothetical protein [Acinetobacter baumannii]